MAKKENTKFKTSVGGQALMEGILMRGPKKQAIVCRKSDGELVSKVEDLHFIKEKYPILGVPFIRGVFGLLDSMVKGMKALTWSIDLLPEEEQEAPSKLDAWIEKKLGGEKAQSVIIGIAVIMGILLSIGLFVMLPAFFFEALPDSIHLVLRCVLEGVIRIIIFLIYLYLCTRLKDIKRMFAYHGAEHKAIFCYEKGLPLTTENVKAQSRFHPRCGTSFMFVVMLISILVISVMTWVLSLFPAVAALPGILSALVRIAAKLVLLPLVIGITYEINRWVGRHENAFSSALSWPGRQLQRLTTFEPDDSMIECAIESLKLVVPENEDDAAW